jgi:hypothetical protein
MLFNTFSVLQTRIGTDHLFGFFQRNCAPFLFERFSNANYIINNSIIQYLLLLSITFLSLAGRPLVQVHFILNTYRPCHLGRDIEVLGHLRLARHYAKG